MSHRLHECAEENRHVVAVAGAQLEHAARGVQHFHVKRILRVAHVALDPAEERVDFADVILRCYAAGQQDVDRLLPHVKVGCPFADEASDVRGGHPGAGQSAGDALAIDARRVEWWWHVARHGVPTSAAGRRRA